MVGGTGLSKIIATLTAIVVVVAIASFLGGMYLGGLGAPRSQVQTLTVPQTVTVMQTVTQAATQAQATVQTTQPPARLPDKIVLGASLPLSGSLADYGRYAYQGIMATVKWVNEVYGGVNLYGRKIPLDVKVYDDESNKENVISNTERLVTIDKVNFLLSSFGSPLVFAQAPIADKYKMLLIGSGGASDSIYEQGYKYVVTPITLASRYQWSALDAIKSLGIKKIALLYRDEEFGRLCGSGVEMKAKDLGLEVVYSKVYPIDIKDFSPYIIDLARSGADALLVCSQAPDGQLVTRQLADAGVNFKFISITNSPCISTDYVKAFGALAEGIMCPSQWEPGLKFSPDLAKRYGIEWFGPTIEEFIRYVRSVAGDQNLVPNYLHALGASGVVVLVKAIEAAQSLDPTAVREAFNKLHIMTFFGEFQIDPATGKQIAHIMPLGQIQAGRFVVVWPPDVAQAKLYYPIPTWDEKRSGKVASY